MKKRDVGIKSWSEIPGVKIGCLWKMGHERNPGVVRAHTGLYVREWNPGVVRAHTGLYEREWNPEVKIGSVKIPRGSPQARNLAVKIPTCSASL